MESPHCLQKEGTEMNASEEVKTGTLCKVCGSEIVEGFEELYDPSTGPPIYGPGSRDQIKLESIGYYCSGCGIKYQFLPA